MVQRRSSREALVGAVLGGRYRVVQHLGSGGTAHVYLAEAISWSPASRRTRLAVKVLRPEHAGAPELVARFEREALAAARVRHPNVLEILAPPAESDGVRFFPMELLVGLDLADTLAYARTLGVLRAVRIAAAAALGLAAAHAARVIHRDVKPENLFLVHTRDGGEAVKLLDFGFASLPEEAARRPGDTVVGTPEYMAPEQAWGAPARPSADIYSLGIVLYEMLAGRVPFSGGYPAIARAHASEPPPPLRAVNPAIVVPPRLEAVVFKAIAKHPDDRFVSLDELRAALFEALPAAAPGGEPTR